MSSHTNTPKEPRTVRKLPPLPARAPNAHKGACGRVLVAGGCRGMAGAPCLAARAAYRSGAGLVKVAVPEGIWDLVAAKLDEATTLGLPQTRSGALSARALEALLEAAAWADVTVLGMGAGQAKPTRGLIRRAVARIEGPLVLDADGLNAFAGGRLGELRRAAERARHPKRRLVVTPHPGEMARLLGTRASHVQKDRRAAALTCAEQSGAVTVLKGAGTIVTDGKKIYVNRTGNAGLASGGTGDVLSGIIGALIGQGMSAFDGACLGVHLHGLAGDLAAKRLGEWSLIAGDLIAELPNAFRTHARKNAR